MLNIISYLKNPSINKTFKPNFKNVIEEHISLLKDEKNCSITNITSHMTYKYENNLYGLLTELKYDSKYHWTIMRVNGFHNPNEFSTTTDKLIIPKSNYIDNLLKIHESEQDNI